MTDFHISGRKNSGTFNQTVAGGVLNIDITYNKWHLENKTAYRYNKTNSKVVEDNWYELVTLKYYPFEGKRIFPGVFYHFDNSLIYRVNNRSHFGIGFGSIWQKKSTKITLLAGIANERSTYNGSEFANSQRDTNNRRNRIFLLKLNNSYSIVEKKINFSYQFFYFQSLKEKSDYDIWLNTRINFNISNNLSFHVVYDYRFENVHLETLSNFNDLILFGFSWSLKSN